MVEFVLFHKGDPLIRSTDRLEVERHRDLLVSNWKWAAEKIEIKRVTREYKYAD